MEQRPKISKNGSGLHVSQMHQLGESTCWRMISLRSNIRVVALADLRTRGSAGLLWKLKFLSFRARARLKDFRQIQNSATTVRALDVPSSLHTIMRLRSNKDAFGSVAFLFITDSDTQLCLSGLAAQLLWDMTYRWSGAAGRFHSRWRNSVWSNSPSTITQLCSGDLLRLCWAARKSTNCVYARSYVTPTTTTTLLANMNILVFTVFLDKYWS